MVNVLCYYFIVLSRPLQNIVREAIVIPHHICLPVHPANKKHLYNISTIMDQRRRRCADIVKMLYKCFVFAGQCLSGMKCVSKHKDLQIFVIKLSKYE